MMKTTAEYIITYSHNADTAASYYKSRYYEDVKYFAEEYKEDDDVGKWYLISRVEITKFLGITIKSSVTDLESWREDE